MPAEAILLLCLIAIFVVPIVADINVGLIAFVGAFAAGALVLDMGPGAVLAGFPAGMFVMLVGITLLLAIANENGTVDWIVNRLIGLSGGRLALLPWVLFLIAFLTSTMGPGAAPVLFVIGVGFCARFGLSPLLIAAMIIHGSQSGGYSPVAPYGLVIAQLASDAGITYSAWSLYTGVAAFHVLLAGCVFVLLGGVKLVGAADTGSDVPTPVPLTRDQALTLAGFVALVLGIAVFRLNVGALALTISLVLLLSGERRVREVAVNRVAWPIVLVICGVLTYVNLLLEAGATDWLAHHAAGLGSPTLIGLLLCLTVAFVTGVASTIGTIGVLVPLSAPFLIGGDLPATGLLTAMSISAAVTDISPFSTWGALFIATAAQSLDRDAVMRRQLIYTAAMFAFVPVVAWLAFVVL